MTRWSRWPSRYVTTVISRRARRKSILRPRNCQMIIWMSKESSFSGADWRRQLPGRGIITLFFTSPLSWTPFRHLFYTLRHPEFEWGARPMPWRNPSTIIEINTIFAIVVPIVVVVVVVVCELRRGETSESDDGRLAGLNLKLLKVHAPPRYYYELTKGTIVLDCRIAVETSRGGGGGGGCDRVPIALLLAHLLEKPAARYGRAAFLHNFAAARPHGSCPAIGWNFHSSGGDLITLNWLHRRYLTAAPMNFFLVNSSGSLPVPQAPRKPPL